jgi:hypothetical protein
MIPFMSEFEILSSTKNAERRRELETEIILKIFDKLMSMSAILFFYKIRIRSVYNYNITVYNVYNDVI